MSKFFTHIPSIGLVVFLIMLAGFCFAQQQEAITITTYYPAPFGVYKNVVLTPYGVKGGDACLAREEGALTYSSVNNKPLYCNGSQWVEIGAGAGPAVSEGGIFGAIISSRLKIEYDDSGNPISACSSTTTSSLPKPGVGSYTSCSNIAGKAYNSQFLSTGESTYAISADCNGHPLSSGQVKNIYTLLLCANQTSP